MTASFLAAAHRRTIDAARSPSAALRKAFAESLADIAARTEEHERCIILSGGVDTCAILAAAREQGVKFAAALTVLTGMESPDRNFAAAAAEEHSLTHYVIEVTSADLIDTYLPACAKLPHHLYIRIRVIPPGILVGDVGRVDADRGLEVARGARLGRVPARQH